MGVNAQDELVSALGALAEDDPEAYLALGLAVYAYSRAGAKTRRRIDAELTRLWRPAARRPQSPRTRTKPQARRSPRRGTVKTTQDPGSDDGGDSDPDPDPVGAAVARLLADAPPFSVGQRELLGRILGGA